MPPLLCFWQEGCPHTDAAAVASRTHCPICRTPQVLLFVAGQAAASAATGSLVQDSPLVAGIGNVRFTGGAVAALQPDGVTTAAQLTSALSTGETIGSVHLGPIATSNTYLMGSSCKGTGSMKLTAMVWIGGGGNASWRAVGAAKVPKP